MPVRAAAQSHRKVRASFARRLPAFSKKKFSPGARTELEVKLAKRFF